MVLGDIPKNDAAPKGIPQKVFNHPVENTILGRGGNGSLSYLEAAGKTSV